jgi:hypothetical protein
VKTIDALAVTGRLSLNVLPLPKFNNKVVK